MINIITKGITRALSKVFTDMDIYTEYMEQEFEEPCFYISSVHSTESPLIGNRYKRDYSFDIMYFPETMYGNEEMNNMAEQLAIILEFIEIDGSQVRGTKINSNVTDGILHFFISYNMHIYKPREVTKDMEILKINSDVKG